MNILLKLLFLFLLTSSLVAQTQELEKVTLQLQWKHQFEFAGFYAAKEKGFYKEAGLDVSLREFQHDIDIVGEVLSGDAEYATGYSSIIPAIYDGKPIIMLANFFKQSPLALVTQKDIKSPADLKNKKIMGISDTIDSITLVDMLEKFSIDRDDYISVPTDFTLKQFLEKKVDAMSVFTTNEIYYLNQAGVKYNLFNPSVFGVEYYDNNLFTSESELKNHPIRVQKFKEASIKGWEYALSHKKELVEIILKKYNSQGKSKDALMFEAMKIESIMLPQVHPVGSIDKERIKNMVDSFKQSGFIDKTKKLNPDNFIYQDEVLFSLTSQEEAYIAKKKTIRICIDSQWMPIEGSVDGLYTGLSSDVIKYMQGKIKVPFEVVRTKNWGESLLFAQEHKCEVLPLLAQTKERELYLNFTEPYLELPISITTKKETRSVVDLHTLKDVKIAIIKNYAYKDLIKNRYPNISIVEVDDIQEGVDKLLNDELFGMMESSVVMEYYFKDKDFSELKFNVQLDEKLQYAMGVVKDDVTLYHIMDKSLKTIDEKLKTVLLQKWFSVKYAKVFDYSLFWKVGAIGFFILLVIIYRQKLLIKHNIKLKQEMQDELLRSREKDQMIFHQNKLISMGEMMENIAHQWRQPLSQINSSVLILDTLLEEKGIKDETLEEKLLEIESLTAYMSNTINDFRNYYSQEKKRERFVLNNVVEEAKEIIKTTFEKSSIQLQVNTDEEQVCYGYPNELKQVILIILNNARDAFEKNGTDEAKVTIQLKGDGFYNKLKICDNAGGIKEEYLDKIFEPYFTTKHKSQGTGLGLYIAKLIIEDSLKGVLRVESNNQGCCFKIKLKVMHE